MSTQAEYEARAEPIALNPKVGEQNRRLELVANRVVRKFDEVMEQMRIGGRKAKYDDAAFEFEGGAQDKLRKKHYDKSLRLLWKAEREAPYLGFKDCSAAERELTEMAEKTMDKEEQEMRRQLTLPEYKELLNTHYTKREKEAIVAILAAIGHGEAYAWLVSAEMLGMVKSTGARAALTMQVFEEAKHFVVLRELIRAFDVPVPRQSAWEYMMLEGVIKAKGLDKFFGMNVLIEGIALSFFGMLSTYPGLDLLRRFHLDESRHTALPQNYFKEFPLSKQESKSPIARMRRLKMLMPALALIPYLEDDLAVLGVDAFEFGGSVLRKVITLSERNGFYLPLPADKVTSTLNMLFNGYCMATRPTHSFKDFMIAETTKGKAERRVEKKVFEPGAVKAKTKAKAAKSTKPTKATKSATKATKAKTRSKGASASKRRTSKTTPQSAKPVYAAAQAQA